MSLVSSPIPGEGRGRLGLASIKDASSPTPLMNSSDSTRVGGLDLASRNPSREIGSPRRGWRAGCPGSRPGSGSSPWQGMDGAARPPLRTRRRDDLEPMGTTSGAGSRAPAGPPAGGMGPAVGEGPADRSPNDPEAGGRYRG
jgi:hypothetical protein